MTKVDISINKVETEENFLGPKVKLKRLVTDQDTGERWETLELAAVEAMGKVLFDPGNGTRVKRAKIDFDGAVDLWGQSV